MTTYKIVIRSACSNRKIEKEITEEEADRIMLGEDFRQALLDASWSELKEMQKTSDINFIRLVKC